MEMYLYYAQRWQPFGASCNFTVLFVANKQNADWPGLPRGPASASPRFRFPARFRLRGGRSWRAVDRSLSASLAWRGAFLSSDSAAARWPSFADKRAQRTTKNTPDPPSFHCSSRPDLSSDTASPGSLDAIEHHRRSRRPIVHRPRCGESRAGTPNESERESAFDRGRDDGHEDRTWPPIL